MNLRWYHQVRYELQRWPFWRFDLNLAYKLKRSDPRCSPATISDNDYYVAMNQWLNQGSWRTETEEPSISVGAVGDMMWIGRGWRNAMSPGVKKIMSLADVTVANLETLMDPSRKMPKWTYRTAHYNVPADYLWCWQDFHSHAQHVFSICNNHILDQGENGLLATRNSLLNQGDTFHCLGGLNDGEDTAFLDIKGLKVGFMASTYAINRLGPKQKQPQGVPVNLFGCPDVEPDWVSIWTQIKILKEQGAEYIVFSPHWGFESEYWPDALQRKHALKLIELGVDLILGHSPHVLQPVELVSINEMDITCPSQVRRPGSKGFGIIAWSLGNFITTMPRLVNKAGAVLQLDLVKRDQQILIKELCLHPVFTACPKGGDRLDRQVMCLDELPDNTLQNQVLRHCQQISPLIAQSTPS